MLTKATGTGIADCHANVKLSGENDLQAVSSKSCMYFKIERKSGKEYSYCSGFSSLLHTLVLLI